MKSISNENLLGTTARTIYSMYQNFKQQGVKTSNEFRVSLAENEVGEVSDEIEIIKDIIDAL